MVCLCIKEPYCRYEKHIRIDKSFNEFPLHPPIKYSVDGVTLLEVFRRILSARMVKVVITGRIYMLVLFPVPNKALKRFHPQKEVGILTLEGVDGSLNVTGLSIRGSGLKEYNHIRFVVFQVLYIVERVKQT